MTYTVRTTKEVTAKEFGKIVISQILERLDKLSGIAEDDLVELLSEYSEVAEFAANIYDDLKAHKLKLESAPFDYEKLTGHEMGIASGCI